MMSRWSTTGLVLSAAVLWAASAAAIDPDLAAWWDFRGATTTTAPDASGNGNTGEVELAVPVTSPRGPALLFPPPSVAVSPAVHVQAGPGTNLHDFPNGLTLEAVIAPAELPLTPGPTGLRLGYIVWADDDVYFLALRGASDGSTQLRGGINCGRSPSGTADVGAAAPFPNELAGAFSHVALTFAAGELRLYLNGVPAAMVVDGGLPACGSHVGPVSSLRNLVRIGGDEVSFNGQRNFRGVIDDVRIWRRALSADEIAKSAASPGCSSAAECDDGDACTVDACNAGACSVSRLSSAPGAQCEMTKVRGATSCTNPLLRSLARVLRQRSDTILRMLRSFAKASPNKARRLTLRADRALAGLDRKLQGKKFAAADASCVTTLRESVQLARDLLRQG